MKNSILFLIALVLSFSSIAQRQGGSVNRGNISTSRSTSVSSSSNYRQSSQSSVSRSSTTPYRGSSAGSRSYNTNESRPRVSNTTQSTSRNTGLNTRTQGSYTRPERQTIQGGIRTPMSAQNPVRTQENNVYGHNNHSGHHVGHHVPHGMHPHPPMYHPIHHRHHLHMHHCIVHDWYCDYYWNNYWYYYHCHPHADVIVYMNDYNRTRIIAIADDSHYIYSLIEENCNVYLTITDETDHVLVKTLVNRRYEKLLVGDGGVWILKRRDKDPIFMMYIDGQLYRYEQD